jgi:hypothetical protein
MKLASFSLQPVCRRVHVLHDSSLEGNGFELPVPVRQAKLTRSCR